jgi:hypothetical protein
MTGSLVGPRADADRHCSQAAAMVDAMPDHELARRLDAAANVAAAESNLERFEAGVAHAQRGIALTQIAEELFLSRKTIETHLRNIFVKLEASSRVEVARAIERSGRPPAAPGEGTSPPHGGSGAGALETAGAARSDECPLS